MAFEITAPVHPVPASEKSPAEGRAYHEMAFDPATETLFVFGDNSGGFFGPFVKGFLWMAKLPR